MTLPPLDSPFTDPENSEYPVTVRAYLAMETALAKRIVNLVLAALVPPTAQHTTEAV